MKIRAYEIKAISKSTGEEIVVDCLPRNKEWALEQLSVTHIIISVTGM
jgi:hypothetical protein